MALLFLGRIGASRLVEMQAFGETDDRRLPSDRPDGFVLLFSPFAVPRFSVAGPNPRLLNENTWAVRECDYDLERMERRRGGG